MNYNLKLLVSDLLVDLGQLQVALVGGLDGGGNTGEDNLDGVQGGSVDHLVLGRWVIRDPGEENNLGTSSTLNGLVLVEVDSVEALSALEDLDEVIVGNGGGNSLDGDNAVLGVVQLESDVAELVALDSLEGGNGLFGYLNSCTGLFSFEPN